MKDTVSFTFEEKTIELLTILAKKHEGGEGYRSHFLEKIFLEWVEENGYKNL